MRRQAQACGVSTSRIRMDGFENHGGTLSMERMFNAGNGRLSSEDDPGTQNSNLEIPAQRTTTTVAKYEGAGREHLQAYSSIRSITDVALATLSLQHAHRRYSIPATRWILLHCSACTHPWSSAALPRILQKGTSHTSESAFFGFLVKRDHCVQKYASRHPKYMQGLPQSASCGQALLHGSTSTALGMPC